MSASVSQLGIVGTGDMGKLYAREFARKGFTVNATDLPNKLDELKKELVDDRINILDDPIEVFRKSDIIFPLTETENVGQVIEQYGRYTKTGATVCPGTSVMGPAIIAAEKVLQPDVNIAGWHWLFGPTVRPKNQTTILVRQRMSDKAYADAMDVFKTIGTNIVELPDYHTHDKITASTQADTHFLYESLGTAWMNARVYPWLDERYVGGIENVKVAMALRIYSGKAHVYGGLAILNNYARNQIAEYAMSEHDLFQMVITERRDEFQKTVEDAAEFVFKEKTWPILLDDRLLDESRLGKEPEVTKPNSNISLLSKLVAWHRQKINPYDNLICQTPMYRYTLGICESLYRGSDLLEQSIKTALDDNEVRKHDLHYHDAVKTWRKIIVEDQNMDSYRREFNKPKEFFKIMLEKGLKASGDLIKGLGPGPTYS